MTSDVLWKEAPEDHDYPAAASYLSLLADPKVVDELIAALRAAPVQRFHAKDILRAAGLPLLPPENTHVAGDLDKISRGHKLSPVLVVRGDLLSGIAAQIADGYHRVCASYHTDENTDIPCHLATLPVRPHR
jgi:hypothetical protein